MDIELFIEKNYKYIFGILLFISLFFVIISISFTVDDSYITFRYAKNFVEYGIWNWNPNSHDKVEAYTNFLYAALAIIPEYLRFNTPLFFKILNLFSFFYLIWRIHSLIPDKTVRIFAISSILLNPNLYFLMFSGLETFSFMVLLFEMTVILTVYKDISSKTEKFFFLILILLPLIRPEGALYSIIGFILFLHKKKKVESKLFLAFVIILGISYFIWRYTYFGYLFPNTFYIKSEVNFNIRSYFHYIIISTLPYLIFSSILLFIVKNKYFRILIFASICVNVFLYAKSDLMMNFADRFPMQIFYPFFIVSWVLVKDIVKNRLRLMLLLLFTFLVGYYHVKNIPSMVIYYPRLVHAHGELGLVLSKYKNENLSLMLGDVGIIPYLSGWDAHDYIGLASPYIAHHKFSTKYVKKISPSLIILYSSTPNESSIWQTYHQNYIYKYILESRKYNLVGAIKFAHSYYLLCFLEKNIPQYQNITSDILQVAKNSEKFKFHTGSMLHKINIILHIILQRYLIFPQTKS